MQLNTIYYRYRAQRLNGLWIHYKHIEPLIKTLSPTVLDKSIFGYSEKGVPIHKILIGKGSIKILIWSQMHGDESTATKVLFDIFNYLEAAYNTDKQLINLLEACTLVFVPMLNPDGALAYTRENANSIDLNRDAIALETKEGQILHDLVSSIQPDYAFNLHDQDSFYNVSGTDQVATFSLLAPASNEEREVTVTRKQAMSVIYAIYQSLQEELPNHIGRYNDTYCTNCFGDQIQKMGVPTILIESGHYPMDENREETRKYHFIALMSALFKIAKDNLPNYKGYFSIPTTDKMFYDIRYDNILYKGAITSVAIRYNDFVINGKLTKVVLTDQTISDKQLVGKLFHKVIDAKGKDFSTLVLK